MKAISSATKALLCLIAFSATCTSVFACSFANGYFHQATKLKGEVVGRSLGPLQFRLLRQLFHVPNIELTLYEFQKRPYQGDLKQIAKTKADALGTFDFGSLPRGHYTLEVGPDNYSQWFDVELTDLVRETESITIDVSPFFPDCTGGHEFIVRNKT